MQSRPKGLRGTMVILLMVLGSVSLLAAFSKPDASGIDAQVPGGGCATVLRRMLELNRPTPSSESVMVFGAQQCA